MHRIYKVVSLFAFSTLLLFFPVDSIAQSELRDDNPVNLISNKREVIPFKEIHAGTIAMVIERPEHFRSFIEQINRYSPVDVFSFSDMKKGFIQSDTLLFVIDNVMVSQEYKELINSAISVGKVVLLCNFSGLRMQQIFDLANPHLSDIIELVGKNGSVQTQETLAMALFGGIAVPKTQFSLGLEKTRLQFARTSNFSEFDIESMTQEIDAIAEEAIREKATPGMVVMAVKDGQVVYEKAYGKHTYTTDDSTSIADIFDLASISKITSTTSVVMNLFDKGLLHLDSTIGYYLPELIGTGKEHLGVKTVLLHEAGFTPFIPFYKNLRAGDMQREYSETHQIKVADSAYLLNNYYKEVMWPQMMNSQLNKQGKYVYSDISMYVMKELAEQITGIGMDEYVNKVLFKPIGMRHTGYNPRNRFDKSKIVPTQHDTTFRKVLLEGYVHDEGAAMAGGVAGHAGLFSTAQDLAVYGQMLLNRGVYGGVKYFNPKTVDMFTSNQSKVSRRGLGFDRADPDVKKEYPSKLASQSVYGHTGYTGTCIWIDPQHNLIYIFLSNRVHPQVSTKLLDLNVRSRIQDVIYFYLL